jgi:hypothetical protein
MIDTAVRQLDVEIVNEASLQDAIEEAKLDVKKRLLDRQQITAVQVVYGQNGQWFAVFTIIG